jgi:adenosylcobinamide-GDP ribazoletransferase
LLTTGPGVLMTCLSVLASRHLLAWACCTVVPSARTQGLGATVAGTVRPSVVGLVFIALLGFSALTSYASGLHLVCGPLMLGSATLGGTAVIYRAIRRFGGITGDVLGAVIEVSFAAALTTSAVVLTVTG